MKKLVLRIYDFISGHKTVACVIILVIMALCVAGVSRIQYDEDISAFLPVDEMSSKYTAVYEKLGGQDKIAFIFSGADAVVLKQAMSCFEDRWEAEDPEGLVEVSSSPASGADISSVYDFIRSNIPLFLNEADYSRMDSLLSNPSYMDERLESARRSMYMPSSVFTSRYSRWDPLDLFTPVFNRLSELNPSGEAVMEDGFLFTADKSAGIIFITSPHGGAESGMNSRISSIACRVASAMEGDYPGLKVIVTGGPVVAAGNAERIKRDSMLSLVLAFLLIGVILFLSYRRIADVLFMALSILFGALFSLAAISLFRSEVSLIILGIGSVIIGIAFNYPLHYIDHLKYQPDRRKALGDQVLPLLVGNITTVGAFLALLVMKAEALRNFGFIGAMLLLGTILFVLFFLPVFIAPPTVSRNSPRLDLGKTFSLPSTAGTAVFGSFLIATAILFFVGRSVRFDTNLQNINYMTEDQKSGFSVLNELNGNGKGERIFIVTDSSDPDNLLDSHGYVCEFFPSSGKQKKALERWELFKNQHQGLPDDFIALSFSKGFTRKAFEPFIGSLAKEYRVLKFDEFCPLLSTVGQSMFFKEDDGSYRMVNYRFAPTDSVESVKSAIREELPDNSFCFSSSDVSGRLASALSDDFDVIGYVCGILVFLLLCVSFGRLELGVMAFIPLAVSWIWILGIMGIAGWQFNVVNVILASFIFGQGDDYTIFMTEGLMHEYATGKKILHSFRNSVTLSALIMFVGIGVLVTARHPAMRSLGQVTVVGMITVVVMARYLPPVAFRFLTSSHGKLREVPVTFLRMLDTVWVLVIFLVSMLVFSVCAAMFFLFGGRSEQGKELYHRSIQGISRISLKCIPGVRHTLANPYGEDFSRPAVVVCNHQSHLDVLSLLALTPKLVILTNDWVWNNPFYGFLIRKAEFYPVSDGFEKNLSRLGALVAKGYSVAVFPEGTRSEDCSILRFHRGAAVLAHNLGLDILPVYIHGFGKMLPKKELMLRRLPVYTEIGKRLSDIGDDVVSFTKELRHHFIQEYSRVCRERENVEYVSYFVKHQYIYKGRDVEKECMSVLRRWNSSEVGSLCLNCKSVSIVNSGYGALPLLLALSHPEIEVHSYETDEDKFSVASHCALKPSNLTVSSESGPLVSENSGKIVTL